MKTLPGAQRTRGATMLAGRLMIGIGLAAACLTGCEPPGRKEAAPEAARDPSTARQAVEGFTGKTAVDAGQRTKERIKVINQTRQEQFEGL